MNWKKLKKIFICMMVMLLASVIFCHIYAEINVDYYNANIGAFKVNDSEEDLDKKTGSSVLLDALGVLVYALASLGEWLLGIIFQAATAGAPVENNIFPWADAILFNAIPFLDINFLNPASSGGSVVGLIRDIIELIYGTIFGLAISFFSIAVLIMGVKVAISTIAAEKAKYKQAMWDWIVGLVLLFTMHLFISFVFYLNEQLVIIAENISSEAIQNAGENLQVEYDEQEMKDEMAIFVSAMYKFDLTDFFRNPLDPIGGLLMGAFEDLYNKVTDAQGNHMRELQKPENLYIANEIINNDKFLEYGLAAGWLYSGNGDWWGYLWGNGDPKRCDFVIKACEVIRYYIDRDTSITEFNEICDQQIEAINNDTSWSNRSATHLLILDKSTGGEMGALAHTTWVNVGTAGQLGANNDRAKGLVEGFKEVYATVKSGQSDHSFLANLAQFFKKAAWNKDGGWKADKIVIQNAIMYAILVVQSFIFLISYTRDYFMLLF